MKAREVKKWLRGTPGCRHGVRYLKTTDEVVSFYVPQLCGCDVTLKGDPITEYPTEAAAIGAASRFRMRSKRTILSLCAKQELVDASRDLTRRWRPSIRSGNCACVRSRVDVSIAQEFCGALSGHRWLRL